MLMLTPQQIRQLRETLGLTATEMAFRLGVGENAIRKWEAGSRHPRYKHLEKLNELLKEAQKQHGLVLA